jgi:mono/diheme cytochrome c family protein
MRKIYFIFSLLLIAGTVHTYAQAHKKTAVKKKPAVVGLSAAVAAGQKIYNQYCLTCHQADGSGVPGLNPPLIQTTFVLGDKTKIITILLNGFSESVEINGDTYSNVMPALSILKDQEIADVLTFVRNNFTNKASQVTAAEVKKIRASGGK